MTQEYDQPDFSYVDVFNSSFVPICSSCKMIRDDEGYWNQIEEYITEHTGAQFSHGICPECSKRLYPELEK